MPIYEYECDKCQNIVEAWQSMTDAPLTKCTECGGSLRKLISTSSFQLKGGGWYADGYGNKKSSAKCEETCSTKPAEKAPECAKNTSCPCASASTAAS